MQDKYFTGESFNLKDAHDGEESASKYDLQLCL